MGSLRRTILPRTRGTAPAAARLLGAEWRPDVAADSGGAAAAAAARPRGWRYAATFSVTGRGRFLGHLDRAEVFRRAVRRAGGHLALSAGMRPKALLGLALPLAVGAEGLEELAEFELAEDADLWILLAAGCLSARTPAAVGARTLRAAAVAGRKGHGGVIRGGGRSDRGGRDSAKTLGEAATASPRASGCWWKSGERVVSAKWTLENMLMGSRGEGGAGDFTVAFRAKVGPAGTTRPERVVEALGMLAGVCLKIHRVTRTKIHLAEGEF